MAFRPHVLELFISESIIVITSEELLSELRRTVIRKFPTFVPNLELLEASIGNDATVVKLGSTTVTVSRDPDDDKVLETALVSGCNYIISGDKDLLSLGTYQNIHMVTPNEFLKVAGFH